MTVSGPDHPLPDDPLASQRADLLRELKGARAELNRVMVELIRSGASTSAADSQLSLLAGLQASIGTADAATLHALGGAIATAVAQSKTLADQAREQASAAAALQSLADARHTAQETIAALDDDLYHKKIFDPYLRFASREDQEAYRQREVENQKALAAARGQGTPEGDLEALAIERRQLLDAGAHGANRSPEWGKRMQQFDEVGSNLHAAMREMGHDTKAADAIDKESTRAFLKAKGLSDSEIDQALQRGHSTAEVIEPYLTKTAEAPSPEKSSDNNKPSSPQLKELADALRAAGVTPSESAASQGHGVQIAATSATMLKRG